MGKHKKPRGKRKVSKEEFDRRYRIWTLVVPIILAVIPAATTIALKLIESPKEHASQEVPSPQQLKYAMDERSVSLENTKALEMESESPNSVLLYQPIQTKRENAYMRWPVIIVILIFPCIFFAAKFIGRTFVRSRYELVEIDEGKKIDGG
jgi:hypothetical protein